MPMIRIFARNVPIFAQHALILKHALVANRTIICITINVRLNVLKRILKVREHARIAMRRLIFVRNVIKRRDNVRNALLKNGFTQIILVWEIARN